MEINDLDVVKAKINRFSTFLEKAYKRSKQEKGWKGTNDEIYGVGNILGTKESGALKRAAMDLKRLLTKKLK